ncbi:hypothetical protein QBC34DRAFT_393671, partial [Podospora aff. communis PSN243]
MLLLPALRCCCFLAFATAAVDRGPCCGRQTMPAHTELHTLHGEWDKIDGGWLVPALCYRLRQAERGEEGSATTQETQTFGPSVIWITGVGRREMRRATTTKSGVPQ